MGRLNSSVRHGEKILASIVDPKGEWAAAIGAMFVAFGSIEHFTVICLKEIPKKTAQPLAKSLKLTQRIDLLLKLLKPYPHSECLVLSDMLEQIKILARTRNLIAHNPLIFQMHDDGNGNLISGAAITAMFKEEVMSLPEAKEFAAASEKMAFEFPGACISAFRAMGLITHA